MRNKPTKNAIKCGQSQAYLFLAIGQVTSRSDDLSLLGKIRLHHNSSTEVYIKKMKTKNTIKATVSAAQTGSQEVDEYIKNFPEHRQSALALLRNTIQEMAPGAKESISYGMPAYKLNGVPLVYFGGYDKHIGFYAIPTAHSAFASELSPYKQGKGSVQFPIEEPLPLELIKKMIAFRIQEVSESKKQKKSS